MNEFLCEWQPSDREQRLNEFAKRYHIACETYDRTVCTGPMLHGSITPATPHEMSLITRNARFVRKLLEVEAQGKGFTREELSRAIGKWDEPI